MPSFTCLLLFVKMLNIHSYFETLLIILPRWFISLFGENFKK